ncbi:MAG: DUF541 domain-containing protein [SAR202 cluster bacterium]|nr:DUF541 domain-containing protein [SAR202 cluster bacterium]
MNKVKILLAGMALTSVALAGIACSDNDNAPSTPAAVATPTAVSSSQGNVPAAPSEQTGAVAPSLPIGQGSTGNPVTDIATREVSSPDGPTVGTSAYPGRSSDGSYPVSHGAGYTTPTFYPQYQYGASGMPTGIWATGKGTVTVDPDLAIINIGVDSSAATVEEARSKAATAMNAIIAAAKGHGIAEADIQTRYFNIYPEYQWVEEKPADPRQSYVGGKQVLVGYRVQNQAVVNVRTMDKVGDVIDSVATGGGNDTRIDGVQFTVEDPSKYTNQLREQAVKEAQETAAHFASITGQTLGKVQYITETSGYQPLVQNFAEDAAVRSAAGTPAPMTPISTGTLELTLTVQAVFGVQ